MHTGMRRLAPLAFLLLLAPSFASAQAHLTTGGMDLRLLRPPLDSKGLLTLNGTDILGENALSFGLIIDAGFGIVPFDGFVNDGTVMAADAERRSRVVDAMFTGTLHGNFGIGNLLVVGAQLPVSVVSGPDMSVPGQYGADGGEGGLSYQGLGGVIVHGKIRLLRSERDPIGLAASVQFEFPTASPSEFSGDSILAITPSLIAEWRPAREVRIGAEVGYRLGFGEGATLRVGGRSEPESPGAAQAPILVDGVGQDLRYEDTLRFGVGFGWRFTDVTELSAELIGSQIIDDWGNPGALSLQALGGLKVFVERNSYLMIGGGAGIPTGGFQAPDASAMLGFVFEPSLGDRDGDGLRDDVDQCPDEPEDFDGFADEDGCPDPDNDRDGILDVDDECPMVPEDRDGDADSDGCPEGNEGDRDGDGILDAEDDCPDDPEDLDGYEDENGCPDADNDSDGILDVDDLCPMDAEDVDDWEDQNGCPDPDNDNDRILDVDDDCPDVAENYNGTEDEDGCYDTGVLVVGEHGVDLLEQIHFEYDSAEILEESFPLLDTIARALNANPQITFVEVQGHADDRGGDDYNIRLTRDRAASVVVALRERGVAPDRMRSAGYGLRCPAVPGRSDAARAANRRVEIKILRTVDGPTGVEIACRAGRELIPR